MSTAKPRSRWLEGILAGILMTLGFTFAPDFYLQWVAPAEPAPRPILPVVTPVEQPAAAVPVAPLPQVIAPTAKRPSSTLTDNAATLTRYAQSCAFWSARDNDASGRIFRDRACQQMREYAAATGQRVPTIRKNASAVNAEKKVQPPVARVVVDECTDHTRGSVRYRQCRGQESQRLKQLCHFYLQREERPLAAAWCAAYESYPVVD